MATICFLKNLLFSQIAVASLHATCNMIYILGKTEKLSFQPLVPSLMRVVSTCLNANEEEDSKEALELLVDLAGDEPLLFKPHLDGVIQGMFTIAQHTQLDDYIFFFLFLFLKKTNLLKFFNCFFFTCATTFFRIFNYFG